MAREKQYVFSARTTEEGLKALNEVKAKVNMNWDELVIEAVSAHYNLDKAMMTLPKKDKPAKAEQPPSKETAAEQPVTIEERPVEAEQEKPAEEPAKRRGKGKGKK